MLKEVLNYRSERYSWRQLSRTSREQLLYNTNFPNKSLAEFKKHLSWARILKYTNVEEIFFLAFFSGGQKCSWQTSIRRIFCYLKRKNLWLRSRWTALGTWHYKFLKNKSYEATNSSGEWTVLQHFLVWINAVILIFFRGYKDCNFIQNLLISLITSLQINIKHVNVTQLKPLVYTKLYQHFYFRH